MKKPIQLCIDATIYTNDGTPQAGPPEAVTGKIGGALDFNVAGDGTRVRIPADTTLDITRHSNWTMSAWVRPTSYSGPDWPTVYNYGISEATLGLAITEAPPGGRIEHWRNEGFTVLHSDDSVTFNAWNHIAVVRDPDTTRFYLNGVYDGFGLSVTFTETGWVSWIGGDVDNPGYDDFLGLIDEVRVSSTDRDSSWFATEYRNQNSPGTFMSFSSQTAVGISKFLAYGISTNNSKAYGTINNQSVSGNITAGEWNHICLSYNKDAGGNDEIKFYVNGTQTATADYSIAISTNSNNLILGDKIGFIGKIDEIRIWNDIRTQQEIQDNMHRVVTPGSETNLVAYWKLNESSGTSAADSKGSNTGTLTNMANEDWVTSTAPFGGGLVNSTTSFTSGTANLGTFSLTTSNAFDNTVNLISTEILNAPNVLPAIARPLNDRYWVVEVYGTPGSYTANVTFTLPPGYLVLGDEESLVLYNRSSNSDNSWVALISGASSMTSTTVTFNGVSILGQFTLGSSGSSLPVELLSFTGTMKDQKVYLNWSTATEVNNYGFEVQRSTQIDKWDVLGFVEGHGNSNSLKEYSYTDAEINSLGIYYYRLRQIDNDGTYELSNQIEVNFNVPSNYELSQNYPNPFNPSTTISFNLPKSGIVTLKVYNLMGEEVKTMVEGYREAGIYTVNFNAEDLASGMYLYRLNTNGFTDTKKLLFMK